MIVWCAIGQDSIIGPYFFESKNENQVTLDNGRYIALVWIKFLLTRRKKRKVDTSKVINQQDGAPLIFSWWQTLLKTFRFPLAILLP